MGSAFGEVFGFLGQNGITPLSQPMSVYMEMDPSILRFRGAVLVSAQDAARASGSIKAATLPKGPAMKAVHVGPYAQIGDSHKALWAHMEGAGLKPQMPVWEIYVDDPGEVAEAELRTEIFRAIG